LNGSVEAALEHFAIRACIGIGDIPGDVAFRSLQAEGLEAAPAADEVNVGVGKDPEKPVLEWIAIVKLVKKPEGADGGFLKQVFGVVDVASEAKSEIVSRAVGRLDVGFKLLSGVSDSQFLSKRG
jgi:hypothetical protein